MPKCAFGEKPQDDDLGVKGKNINMVFLNTPFLTAIVKTLKQKLNVSLNMKRSEMERYCKHEFAMIF
jgi:hypothetical protein